MGVSKGILAAAAFAALALASPQAGAADIDPATGYPIYISIFGGASFLSDVETYYAGQGDYSVKTKSGYLVGGAIGYKWNDMIRTEIELSHSRWKASSYVNTASTGSVFSGAASGPIKATYLLGNLWADLNTDSPFTPYVGVGLGIGWADADAAIPAGSGFGYGDGESGLAFQIGGGVKYDVSEAISVDLGYRFKGLTNIDFKDRSGTDSYVNGDLYSHNVQLGLTFNF